MTPFAHPPALPRSDIFTLTINGTAVETLHTGVADYAIAALDAADFPVRIEVLVNRDIAAERVAIRPLSKDVAHRCEGRAIRFTLHRAEKLSIDLSHDAKPLYLFCAPPIPAPAPGPDVITLPAGRISEVPLLTLDDGQTLHLPGGSVFKGRIHIKGRKNVRIVGHGIIDGSCHTRGRGEKVPCVVLEDCAGVNVEGVTMVRPAGWMLVFAASQNIAVRDLRQIGEVVSSDGIDVVGSRDVLIEDCFLHNNDDCVVVKALDIGAKHLAGVPVIRGRGDVENVTTRRCTLANWTAGNAMEIGHELSADRVCGITFSDIDVLHVHGHGAVFSLHNYGRALVENILYENIRIEHCYDKFIDMRVARSRYTQDPEPGRIRGVVLRDIHWHRADCNLGYTTSLIGGLDADHRVEDVVLENIRINGHLVHRLDELEIYTRHCLGLRLEAPAISEKACASPEMSSA